MTCGPVLLNGHFPDSNTNFIQAPPSLPLYPDLSNA